MAKLQFDINFIRRAKRLGLETLEDVMTMSLSNLRTHSDFSYIWYATLLEVLEKHQLLEEFQRRQL